MWPVCNLACTVERAATLDRCLHNHWTTVHWGIWHFGYSVSRKQFDSTIAELKKKGIEVTGHSEYKNGVRMAFLDPRKTGGIVFQLHDCPPEMEDFFDTMGMVVG
jgi:hypothetical protein